METTWLANDGPKAPMNGPEPSLGVSKTQLHKTFRSEWTTNPTMSETKLLAKNKLRSPKPRKGPAYAQDCPQRIE